MPRPSEPGEIVCPIVYLLRKRRVGTDSFIRPERPQKPFRIVDFPLFNQERMEEFRQIVAGVHVLEVAPLSSGDARTSSGLGRGRRATRRYRRKRPSATAPARRPKVSSVALSSTTSMVSDNRWEAVRTSRIRRGGQCSSNWAQPSGATPRHRARRSTVQMRATPQGGQQPMWERPAGHLDQAFANGRIVRPVSR